MKKRLFVYLAALALSACTSTHQTKTPIQAFVDDRASLVGTWGMIPLRNGIANVVEYTADGQSKLHAFNCEEPKSESEVELADYRLSDDGKTLHVSSPQRNFDLQVLAFTPRAMRLAMQIEGTELTFTYIKLKAVAPLCFLYSNPERDESKQKPYQTSDFIPAPIIPQRADIERYVGKWANERGEIQIEVVKDASGTAKLYHQPSKNWHYLYNQVTWQGAELHYQSFAYSEQETLFKHPFHKSVTSSILTPLEDPEKIMHSFFIGHERFDYVLTRSH